MATPVIMPRQGQSVESCLIAGWHKKKGDRVQEGDVLFTYETDKAAFDEEAKVSGILLDIFFKEGDDVPVLTNVCVIGENGESTVQYNPHIKTGAEVKEDAHAAKDGAHAARGDAHAVEGDAHAMNETDEQKTGDAPLQGQDQSAGPAGDEKVKISPRARNLAEKLNVDYRNAAPTGPDGRIIERDIRLLREKGPAAALSAKTEDVLKEEIRPAEGRHPEYEEVKLTNIRKVIAKTMYKSISTTAQLTLNTSFDASGILAYRKKLKENKEGTGVENITLNDMILYAISRTILNHKALNAHFFDDKMLFFNNAHIGVAIDTARGLMAPTVFNANLKPLNEISREVKKLAEECRKGTISPDYLNGASFTVTNLGVLGIESFTPVLNPPQTGILGINNIIQRVREVNGEYAYYPAMGLSLTFDHRAVDGVPAARFLQELKINLENFNIMLAR